MRRATAITLALLGGGTVGAAVAVPLMRTCTDPVTGVAVTCPSSSRTGGMVGTRVGGTGGLTQGNALASVARAGFGAAGAAVSSAGS